MRAGHRDVERAPIGGEVPRRTQRCGAPGTAETGPHCLHAGAGNRSNRPRPEVDFAHGVVFGVGDVEPAVDHGHALGLRKCGNPGRPIEQCRLAAAEPAPNRSIGARLNNLMVITVRDEKRLVACQHFPWKAQRV